jgi:hypothetical protein
MKKLRQVIEPCVLNPMRYAVDDHQPNLMARNSRRSGGSLAESSGGKVKRKERTWLRFREKTVPDPRHFLLHFGVRSTP